MRIEDGSIRDMGQRLAGAAGDHRVNADGGLLLPGLHDHHIHLMAFAASLDSLQCGPPAVRSEGELAAALRARNTAPPRTWVRGIGYHPCVAGDIDRDWLDRHIPDQPVRLQHRGGRLWILNSLALEILAAASAVVPSGLERVNGRPTGRLYEGDVWLRDCLGNPPPELGRASEWLASCGVTGVTDTTPTNDVPEWRHFDQCQAEGALRQRVRMMGSAGIARCCETDLLQRGEYKVHLLESRLPELDSLCRDIETAHSAGRSVAVHCVSLVELVFALNALGSAGPRTGDRIEHASVCPPDQMETIRELGLRVVTQPHFIAERGDQYLDDVDAADRPWLYRAASFAALGIPLAGGSDAPFGDADPWRSMRAAVERRTPSGQVVGREEMLTPEQALDLYLSPPDRPGYGATDLAVGACADLCLLHNPWDVVREDLDRKQVRATWRAGELIYWSG